MKKMATFAFALILALASLTLLAPAEVGASYCTSIPPFGASDADECLELCITNHGCGIDRYDSSTACCFCGYKV